MGNGVNDPMELNRFKETMRQLCVRVEDQEIENMVYFDLIIESGIISLKDLKQRVDDALLDPDRRKKVREMYSAMWKAIDDSGTNAVAQDLLNNLPPTDKPN